MKTKVPTYVRRDAFTGPKYFPWFRLFKNDKIIKKYHLNLASGSREHYFHFLIGYLLPLIWEQNKRQLDAFNVLDCGPIITPILSETLSRLGYNFEIKTVSEVNHKIYVEPWDIEWYNNINPDKLFTVVNLVTKAWEQFTCYNDNCATSENLLIQRSNPHSYYLDGSAERHGYGLSRRGITNMDEISTQLFKKGTNHSIYLPGNHCLGCQIKTFSKTNRLFGLRGAEWANLVWANSDVKVLIVDPKPPAVFVTNLLTSLGMQYEFLNVKNSHPTIDPEHVIRFFRD